MQDIIESQAVVVAGAVLAGGRSRRMGCDKAQLRIRGRSFLDVAVSTIAPLAAPLFLSGGDWRHPQAIPVPDLIAGCGPLGGIFSVLSASPNDAVLIVSVDTPLLKTATLRHLLDRSCSADIAVIRTADGRVQPVCGIYRRACIQPIRSLIENGRMRVDALFDDPGLNVNIVDARDLDAGPLEFLNVNTPEDYDRACREN